MMKLARVSVVLLALLLSEPVEHAGAQDAIALDLHALAILRTLATARDFSFSPAIEQLLDSWTVDLIVVLKSGDLYYRHFGETILTRGTTSGQDFQALHGVVSEDELFLELIRINRVGMNPYSPLYVAALVDSKSTWRKAGVPIDYYNLTLGKSFFSLADSAKSVLLTEKPEVRNAIESALPNYLGYYSLTASTISRGISKPATTPQSIYATEQVSRWIATERARDTNPFAMAAISGQSGSIVPVPTELPDVQVFARLKSDPSAFDWKNLEVLKDMEFYVGEIGKPSEIFSVSVEPNFLRPQGK